MPSKNIVKIYVKDGIYHVYNRGVEKRDIFLDDQDYKVFLHFLKRYLTSPENSHQGRTSLQVQPVRKLIRRLPPVRQTDIYKEIQLFCYCLMPNHFHLMIKQLTDRAVIEFMKRLSNAYTKYFNEKYDRVGSLFQGRYKAALIKKEPHFIHLPYYIHYNPVELFVDEKDIIERAQNYPWSSYADYLGQRNTSWIYKKGLMEYFIESEEKKFGLEGSKEILGNLTLE